MTNPYLSAWRVRRKNRRDVHGGVELLFGAVPIAAVVIASPFISPIFVGELSEGRGLAAITSYSMRIGWLLCAVMSLHTYTAIFRDRERSVLEALPVEPATLLRYLLVRTAWERIGLMLGGVLFLWPVALSAPLVWAVCGVVIIGGWFSGLVLGLVVHLAAIHAAESERLASLFELIRGANPRLHAALLYSPGVVLALGGLAVWASAMGALTLLGGEGLPAAAIAAPFVLAIAMLPAIAPLAKATYYRATFVLAEIDGWYARLESEEERSFVYLQWVTPMLPPADRPIFLKELRAGWRAHRAWVNSAWLAGGLAAIAAWSKADAAMPLSFAIAGAAAIAVGAIATRLAPAETRYLDELYPAPAVSLWRARTAALVLWLQGVVIPPAIATLLHRGVADTISLVLALEVLVIVYAVAGAHASRSGARGLVTYVPVTVAAFVLSQAGGLL